MKVSKRSLGQLGSCVKHWCWSRRLQELESDLESSLACITRQPLCVLPTKYPIIICLLRSPAMPVDHRFFALIIHKSERFLHFRKVTATMHIRRPFEHDLTRNRYRCRKEMFNMLQPLAIHKRAMPFISYTIPARPQREVAPNRRFAFCEAWSFLNFVSHF